MWTHKEIYELFYWNFLSYYIDNKLFDNERTDKRGNIRPLDAKAWWLVERGEGKNISYPAMDILQGLSSCKWEYYRILKNYVSKTPSNPVKDQLQFIDPAFFYRGFNFMQKKVSNKLSNQVKLICQSGGNAESQKKLFENITGRILLQNFLLSENNDQLNKYPNLKVFDASTEKISMNINSIQNTGIQVLHPTKDNPAKKNNLALLNNQNFNLYPTEKISSDAIKASLYNFVENYFDYISNSKFENALKMWTENIRINKWENRAFNLFREHSTNLFISYFSLFDIRLQETHPVYIYADFKIFYTETVNREIDAPLRNVLDLLFNHHHFKEAFADIFPNYPSENMIPLVFDFLSRSPEISEKYLNVREVMKRHWHFNSGIGERDMLISMRCVFKLDQWSIISIIPIKTDIIKES